MNKDLINLSEAYSRIYLKEDENFHDQINPSAQERAESVYGEEIPPVEGESEDVNEDAELGSYTLYYKDPEQKKTSPWYTAKSLEELLQLVNKGNTGEEYDLPVVDEDRVFNSVEELLDFASHSDFFVKGPDGNLVSGYPVKSGDWEELGEDSLQTTKKRNTVANMIKIMNDAGESSQFITDYLKNMIQNSVDVPEMPSLQDQIDWAVDFFEKKALPKEVEENDDDLNEKKEKFTINTPTQGELVAKTRAPIHKPTMQIKPKKGIYNRQQFKRDHE